MQESWKRETCTSRLKEPRKALKEWCHTNRHRPARGQRARLSAVLNGHYAYYGIAGNIRRLQAYRYQVVRIWHKWLERISRVRNRMRETRSSGCQQGA